MLRVAAAFLGHLCCLSSAISAVKKMAQIEVALLHI